MTAATVPLTGFDRRVAVRAAAVKLAQALLLNGVYLAFIPVFAEAAFWLLELARRPPEEPGPVS